jgi:hypothetical protein
VRNSPLASLRATVRKRMAQTQQREVKSPVLTS